MITPGVVVLLVALILAGASITAFVILFANKAPWWRHQRTPANPAGVPNVMGRALMWLGTAWAAELDTTLAFSLMGPHHWQLWVAVAIHLYVTAAGVNLLLLLFRPQSGIPTTEERSDRSEEP